MQSLMSASDHLRSVETMREYISCYKEPRIMSLFQLRHIESHCVDNILQLLPPAILPIPLQHHSASITCSCWIELNQIISSQLTNLSILSKVTQIFSCSIEKVFWLFWLSIGRGRGWIRSGRWSPGGNRHHLTLLDRGNVLNSFVVITISRLKWHQGHNISNMIALITRHHFKWTLSPWTFPELQENL